MNCIIEALEHNGIGFDWHSYKHNILEKKEQEQKDCVLNICNMLNCNSKVAKDFKKLIWKLYSNNIFPESLSFEYLKANKDVQPIYGLLYRYKRISQFLNQYGNKLYKQIKYDGRIHAKWSIDGAKTGRMSCKEPNLQAFPSEIKPYFKPKEGNCFVSGDYSQIELRVLAELSQDKNLIEVLKQGNDIHTNTASSILNKPINLITDEDRTIGKRVNFGMCYGISAYGLCETVNKYTAQKITLQEADLMKQHFYNTYPIIKQYHNYLLTAQSIKSLGGNEWINYPKGIARINLPVQASAAEGLKLALSMLIKNMPDDCLLVNVIHDQIVLETPLYKAEKTKTLLQQCMVDGMQKLVKNVPIIVDTNIIF